MNFYDLDTKIQEPLKYNLKNYADDFSRVGSANLKSLTDEDMSQVSQEDIINDIEEKRKNGFNPSKLGEPMTDLELMKFAGYQ